MTQSALENMRELTGLLKEIKEISNQRVMAINAENYYKQHLLFVEDAVLRFRVKEFQKFAPEELPMVPETVRLLKEFREISDEVASLDKLLHSWTVSFRTIVRKGAEWATQAYENAHAMCRWPGVSWLDKTFEGVPAIRLNPP